MKEDVTYTYPPADLISALVDIYFTHFNIHTPLLHRPTFEQNIKDGLHLRNPGFGASLLLVCALGSKFSNDTRVLLDSEREKADRWEQEHAAHPDEEDHRWHSAGWKWFMQVHQSKKSMSLSTPSVYDLQVLYVSEREFVLSPRQTICFLFSSLRCMCTVRLTARWRGHISVMACGWPRIWVCTARKYTTRDPVSRRSS